MSSVLGYGKFRDMFRDMVSVRFRSKNWSVTNGADVVLTATLDNDAKACVLCYSILPT